MPSVLSVGSSKPLLDLERFACREVRAPFALDHLEVIRMEGRSPAPRFSVVLRKTRVVSPCLVAKLHETVGSIPGNKHRDRVNGQLKLRFGPLPLVFRALTLGDFQAQ